MRYVKRLVDQGPPLIDEFGQPVTRCFNETANVNWVMSDHLYSTKNLLTAQKKKTTLNKLIAGMYSTVERGNNRSAVVFLLVYLERTLVGGTEV